MIARARVGDPDARQHLTRTYYPRVYRYVLGNLSRSRDEHDAEDITQNAFIRAMEALPLYSGGGSFLGWLITIARRTASDFYRRRATASASPDDGAEADESATDERTPLDQLLEGEETVRVRRAHRMLSPDQREVLSCRIWAGLSVKETAQVMERSEAAVKMLQFRATAALAGLLEGDNELSGEGEEA